MKVGTENRKKTIVLGAIATVAVLAFGYQLYGLFGGPSSPTPPPTIAPLSTASTNQAPVDSTPSRSTITRTSSDAPPVAGINVTRLSDTSSGLDPTLDEAAMLRTESLEYSGSGRNIFSATYTAPVEIPTNIPSARPGEKLGPAARPGPPPPPPVCPPQCAPIPIKFFGTEKFPSGKVQGFFLDGENVYMAAEGEIVARKYKVLSITASSARLEDMTNTFEQTLALQNQ